VYLNTSTGKDVLLRFSYCFEQAPGSDYPAILESRAIEAGETRMIDGKGGTLALSAFLLQHGNIPALGYRIGDAAYTPDVNDIPEASWPALENLELWIIDALRYTPHPSHFCLDDALAWVARFKPRRAVLTNLHSDLDYDELRRRMPDGVVPGYDGMRLEIAG
jgi:phosphoribosyl 1,2-cyclic phosphate phosphodiesterase